MPRNCRFDAATLQDFVLRISYECLLVAGRRKPRTINLTRTREHISDTAQGDVMSKVCHARSHQFNQQDDSLKTFYFGFLTG